MGYGWPWATSLPGGCFRSLSTNTALIPSKKSDIGCGLVVKRWDRRYSILSWARNVKKLGTWYISVITYYHQLLCNPVIKTKKRRFLCIPNSMKKSSFCSTGPMLIVAAFCIALNVTLQEVGEHDLVGLRFGGFKSLEVLGDLVFMVVTKGTKMNLSKKNVQEKLNNYFLLQHLEYL